LSDRILRYIAADGHVRIILADTSEACEEARRVHCASPVAAAAMGRALTAALMLATELKGNGSLTAIVAGDGPIGRIVAVARPGGDVKVTCSNPLVDLPARADGKLDVAGAVGRQGRLSVVKDLGIGQPWSGQVDLVSGELGQDFAMYLAKSEQQPSIVSLGVLVSPDCHVLSAGGVIVQPLPGCPEEIVSKLEETAPKLADISRKLQSEGAEGLVASAFAGMGPELAGSMPVWLRCDCSRERIERALISMGAAELSDMIRKDGGAEVCCHFCNAKYAFTANELETLMNAAQKRKP
jgi:molecular chaperone Hsp33